jgi:ankyrin repeat protein
LKEIDLRQEALSKLDEDIANHVVDGDHERQTRFKTLYQARNVIFHKVLGMLHLAKDLAVRVEEAGNTTEAYIAYTRVLEGYYTLDMPACYEIRTILIRMAKLLWTLGDEYRAQSLAWRALGSRDQLHRAQESDLEVLKDIAKSLLRTFPVLSQLIQIEMIGQVPCNCNSLLPPLHAMVESNYASQVPGNVLQSGFHPTATNDNTPASPIVGGVHAIMELLGEFTDADLDARDFNRQTLLHLAALRCKEGLGYAMMIRAKYDARLLHRMVNARDKSGQTVLTVAISSGCSLTFITALLDNGAEYEPGTMPEARTPLQAACSIGSLEIVDLLLTRGASFDNAYPGSGNPYTIAQEQGHFDIADRLIDSSPGSLSSHTADESDSGG